MNNSDIELIDSGLIREGFAGTWLIEDNSQIALVEVSCNHMIPDILKRLDNLGQKPEDVKYIIVTHIHLDHASGVGNLLKYCPNAKLIVHPSGAKHMINPERLIQGAIAVYGEEVVKKDYGEISNIDPDRVIECQDGEKFTLGERVLTTWYTPGHARHHISIYDSKNKGLFTGDSLGLRYQELDVEGRSFYQPTTTPTAFEYDMMCNSIEKMKNLHPVRIYFTHYGMSEKPDEIFPIIKKRLDDYISLVNSLPAYEKNQIPVLENKLEEYYIRECREHGVLLNTVEIRQLFDIDIKLNAMGLLVWKQREVLK